MLHAGVGVTDGELEGFSQGGGAAAASGVGLYSDFAIAADGQSVTRYSSTGLAIGAGSSWAPEWMYTW